MNKDLFISTRGRTHAVALIEGGCLAEFNSENEDDASIVGNIYRGKVEQCCKGMQAVFVNIGRKKNGYLYLGETIVDGQDMSETPGVKINPIQDLSVGDEVMVQVAKTEIGQKGARLTANISLAGRYLVYMPSVDYIGVSRKIEDELERERLVNLVSSIEGITGGFIIRTACEGGSAEEIEKDARTLQKRWENVLSSYEQAPPKSVCYAEGGILWRCVRDLAPKKLDKIVVDNPDTFLKMREYLSLEGFDPKILSLFSNDCKDLFNYHGLTAELLHVLDSKVELENGAYLVIEATEALTVIDVNTGRFVGTTNLEETVFETNMLAAKAIAAQLRLRNIGGIIIVDFIDMVSEEHKAQVVEELSEAVKKDRTRTAVIDMTPLGLVEITRKKSRTEVKQKLSKPCSFCGGKGYIMSNESLARMIKAKLFELFSDSEVTAAQINLNKDNLDEFFANQAFTFETTVFWQDKRIYLCETEGMSADAFEILSFKSDAIEVPKNAKLLY